jgi:hypothetical protein
MLDQRNGWKVVKLQREYNNALLQQHHQILFLGCVFNINNLKDHGAIQKTFYWCWDLNLFLGVCFEAMVVELDSGFASGNADCFGFI